MILSTQKTNNLIKNFSPVLSNSAFNKIVRKGDYEFIEKRVKKYLVVNSDVTINTYFDFYEHLYKSMLKTYRNEFIYKNEIVNKILLGRYSLNTANVLNEFRIGKSIADLVLLNGTSIVYEIKTEYDSPERLLSQINDYRKSFLNVVIVTHHTHLKKYQEFLLLNDLKNIGLIILTQRNTLKLIIKPKEDSLYLDNTYMFKCLRKTEYINLIKKHFGYIPDVTNTKVFKECLFLAGKIDKKDFHDLMFNYLKKRTVTEKKVISSCQIPTFLKHISICSDYKKKDIEKLNLFLNKKL